jgi:FKBP-type peptidyl-prolyl cis-trans isomerase FklB
MKAIVISGICATLLMNTAFADTAPAAPTTAPAIATAAVVPAASVPEAVADVQKDPAMANLQAGELFLAKNKTKPGVVTLPDGLQYKILIPGQGAKPQSTDIVKVEYTGSLINGEVFDSSDKHDGAATFGVNQVIAGWTEALQLMPVGSTWELTIPAKLAYGEQGAHPLIGPDETLIFKVKLLDIVK